MKQFFKIALIALALMVSVAPLSDAKIKRTKNKSAASTRIANVNELMRATSVTPNRDGFINRDNAPQRSANIKAVPFITADGNNVITKIYIKGKLTQNINDYFNFTYEGFDVYYLDFNYDDYTDICVISKIFPYGGATWLLWNPNLKKFELSNVSAQYFSLHPRSKTINFYYSSSMLLGEDLFQKCIYRNNKIETIEELVRYGYNEPSRPYFLRDPNSAELDDFDNSTGLSEQDIPKEWFIIMDSFGDIVTSRQQEHH